MKKINFNLSNNEVIVKVAKVKAEENLNMSKLYVYKMLKILDYEGLLSRGYLTRVENGHIGYNASLLMVRKLVKKSKFKMRAVEVKRNHFVIALIEKLVVVDDDLVEENN